MASKTFNFRDVLGFGWCVMKANFWFFAGVIIVAGTISLLPGIFEPVVRHLPYMVILLYPAALIMNIVVGIGFFKITISFCDGRKPKFSTLFDGWDCFWRYLGTGLVYGLIIMGTAVIFILLSHMLGNIFGGIIAKTSALVVMAVLIVVLAIRFSLWFYFVIDKELGPINALRASSQTTMGAEWRLLGFYILCGLINLLGWLCLFVGVFATFPMIMVATALVYRQLSAQTPELAELGIICSDIAPVARDDVAADIQPARGIQSEGGIRIDAGLGSGLSIRLSQGVQLSPVIRTGRVIRPAHGAEAKREKKSSKSLLFWVVALGIAVVIVAGIGYYFWPAAKGGAVLRKDVALTGILYSEDNPSAVIGGAIVKEGDMISGVKVVKIHKDSVEFEKNGKKWTQQAK